jgi:protein-disulfide isomerase
MSTPKPAKRPRRKRPVVRHVSNTQEAKARRAALPLVYAIFGLVVVIGLIAVTVRYRNGTAITASKVSVTQAVRPLTVPAGQTPEGYWYKGQAEAPVIVIEFGDYQCPSCGAAFQQLEPGIDKDYVNTGKIKFVFHNFPLAIHPNAAPTAAAARCAGDQGKYWSMHDLLYARQSEWSDEADITTRLKTYAGELSLDTTAFGTCVDNGKYKQAIQDAITDSTKQGINATPTYLVDGKKVDANGLRAAIEAAVTAKGR